jgi:hypothetical protein
LVIELKTNHHSEHTQDSLVASLENQSDNPSEEEESKELDMETPQDSSSYSDQSQNQSYDSQSQSSDSDSWHEHKGRQWNYFGDKELLQNDIDSESESEEETKIDLCGVYFEMPDTFETKTDYMNKIIDMMYIEHRNPEYNRIFVVEQTLTKDMAYEDEPKLVSQKFLQKDDFTFRVKEEVIKEKKKDDKEYKAKNFVFTNVRTHFFFATQKHMGQIKEAVEDFFDLEYKRETSRFPVNSFI